MTALTPKQRVKVNAALCMIHDSGRSAQSVADYANAMIAIGHPAHSAYEKALNAFAAQVPTLGPALGQITRLIEASSPGAVAQYDHALSTYIETGDDAAMIALAPTIAADSVALAIHNRWGGRPPTVSMYQGGVVEHLIGGVRDRD